MKKRISKIVSIAFLFMVISSSSISAAAFGDTTPPKGSALELAMWMISDASKPDGFYGHHSKYVVKTYKNPGLWPALKISAKSRKLIDSSGGIEKPMGKLRILDWQSDKYGYHSYYQAYYKAFTQAGYSHKNADYLANDFKKNVPSVMSP